MNREMTVKLGLVALLMMLLMIPLLLIGGLVEERQGLRDRVLEDIANSASRQQQVIGPLLVLPYRKTVREWKTHAKTGQRYEESHVRQGRLYFLPERLQVTSEVSSEPRSRGIYQALLYHSRNQFSGHFQVPANYGISADWADYVFDTPYLSVGISDIRGIESSLQLRWNEQTLAFTPGSGELLLESGVHADLPLPSTAGQQLAFTFDLALQGTRQLALSPLGRDSQWQMRADWPHPSFVGQFLPQRREVTAEGFTAHWQSSFFATNYEERLQACLGHRHCLSDSDNPFAVSFINPVDQYLKSERAIKYALLFIALTFAGFFLFEVLKRLAVHPMQYGLVGLALALFYLLLLSLAEHVPFALAYLLAAAACVLLLGIYLSAVLRSAWRGGAFALALGLLYGLLYVLLDAEDYALLMGSLLVFGLLAGVMLLTRRLDWYSLGRGA